MISPMSVSYLMGMLANGADGITQQEILKAIGCEGVSVNDLNELYKAMLLHANHQDKQTTVNIANYIAVNKNFKLDKNFCQQVSDSYQLVLKVWISPLPSQQTASMAGARKRPTA